MSNKHLIIFKRIIKMNGTGRGKFRPQYYVYSDEAKTPILVEQEYADMCVETFINSWEDIEALPDKTFAGISVDNARTILGWEL